MIDGLGDEDLGLGAGDQHGRRDAKGQRVDFFLPDQIGHGLVLADAADELAIGR